jgi:hypothetical protein
VSIIEAMVIDMIEAQVRTLEQVRQVLAGTSGDGVQAAHQDDEGRYAWIEQVLQRFGYRQLPRGHRGPVLAYLQRLSGYSRAQITRLVARAGTPVKPLVKNYGAPRHAVCPAVHTCRRGVAGRCGPAMGTLSGPATACVLRRQRDVFGPSALSDWARSRWAPVQPAPQRGYRPARGADQDQATRRTLQIGVRKAPAPEGRPGFIRIDSVHQGDLDGIKGLYHINAVDCVTQWQVVASVQTISEAHLLQRDRADADAVPVRDPGLPRRQRQRVRQPQGGADAGQAAHRVHAQPPRHSNDNGLAETKNGAVVRKEFGYEHIHQRHAARFDTYCREYLNPFLNYHRPCLFATDLADPKKPGRIKRVYRPQDAMTPLDKLASLPEAAGFLRPGMTLAHLRALAMALTDMQAAEELNDARQALFNALTHAPAEGARAFARGAGLWTCGRCAGAHRRGPWTT